MDHLQLIDSGVHAARVFTIYSGTKAFLHSYAISQRFMLRETSVKVLEIEPPWVGIGLVCDPLSHTNETADKA
jgi:short-subunit dehydrogenase involved in D-alanine esterification of teichoic acids